MPTQKLSISLEKPVLLAARKSAERREMSLSAWLNQAAASALETEVRLEDGLAAVAEWEAECGPPSADEVAEANAVLDAAGIGLERESHRAA